MGLGQVALEKVFPSKFSVVESNCCGCMQCMLICSFVWGEKGKLDASGICISRRKEDNYQFAILFNDFCRPSCKMCAKWCPYQALKLEGR